MKPEFDVVIDETSTNDSKANRQIENIQINTGKGIMKEFSQQIIDDIDLTIEPEKNITFYHYKR